MPAPPRSIRRAADGVLTVVLTAAMTLIALAMVVYGPLLAMAGDACGDHGYRCSYGWISAGSLVAAFGPAVPTAAVLVAVVVRRRRGRATSPLALVGVAAVCGVVVLGQAIIGWAIVPG